MEALDNECTEQGGWSPEEVGNCAIEQKKRKLLHSALFEELKCTSVLLLCDFASKLHFVEAGASNRTF